MQVLPWSCGTGACEACLELAVWGTAVGPCFMVRKCLPSSVENWCFLIGLVTTLKSGTTVDFRWCHWCGALIPECSLCQLMFTEPWMTPGLLPYSVDWAFNLLCLNFLVGMSWNCTESRSLKPCEFLLLWMLYFSFSSCKSRVSSGSKSQLILYAQHFLWENCQILFWGRLIKDKMSLE